MKRKILQIILNVFVRPVLLNSHKISRTLSREIQIDDIFFGSEYDGSFFSNFLSSAYEVADPNKNYQDQSSNNCEYVYFQAKDIRTFEWYTKSILTKYLNPIEPQIYIDPCSNTFKGSLICQRSQTIYSSSKKPFSVMCNSFKIDQLSQYFSEYSLYSDFSLVVDPASLKVVYISTEKNETSKSIKHLKEYSFFTDDIDPDSNQLDPTYSLIEEIQQYFQEINNLFFEKVNIQDSFDTSQSQRVINYTKNNTEYEIIVNAIRIYSKINYLSVPKGYQLVNLYMFLDVLSKKTLISEGVELKNNVTIIEIILVSCFCVVIFCFILRVIYHALDKSNLIDIPISNLTEILQTIQFQSLLLDTSNLPNGIDMVDIESLNEKAESYHSYETKILFESFQNLFDMLRFTTQELYQQNDGLALLNLCNQVKHFEKFKNLRALGICHNNIGNIHYNNQRYVESLQEYQKAIIYSQYELKCYQDQIEYERHVNDVNKKSSSSQGSRKPDKGKLSNSLSLFQFLIKFSFQKQKEAEILQKLCDQKQENGQQELYWNLFNRKFNFLKCFIMYIESNSSQNQYFWEDAYLFFEEILEISNVFLNESKSRLILLNHFKFFILSRFKTNSNELFLQVSLDNDQIIKKILQQFSNVNDQEEQNNLVSLNSNFCKSPILSRAISPLLQKLKTTNRLLDLNSVMQGQQNLKQEITVKKFRFTNQSHVSLNNQQQSELQDYESKSNQPNRENQNQNLQIFILIENEEDFFGIKLLKKLQQIYKYQKDHSFTSLKTIRPSIHKSDENQEQVFITQVTQPLTTRMMLKETEETPKIETLIEFNDALNKNNQQYADSKSQQTVMFLKDQKYQILKKGISYHQFENNFDNIIENDNPSKENFTQDYLQSDHSNKQCKIEVNSQFNKKISSNRSSGDINFLSEEQEEQFKDQSPQQSPTLDMKEYVYPNIFLSPPQNSQLPLINKNLQENQLSSLDIKCEKLQSTHNFPFERDKDGKDQLISFSIKNQCAKSIQMRSKQNTQFQSAYFIQPEQQTMIQQNIQNDQNIKQIQKSQVNNNTKPLLTEDQLTLIVSPKEDFISKTTLQQHIKNPSLNIQNSFNVNVQKSPLLKNNNLFHNQFIFESTHNLKKVSVPSQGENNTNSVNNKNIKNANYSPPFLKIGSFRNLKSHSYRASRFCVNDNNAAYYNFPKDILCQYVLDVNSDILIKEGKYLMASKLLTACIEQGQVYLPQLKYMQLCKLKSIFTHHNINSDYLSSMINSFNPNIKFKIQFVSFCSSDQGKFESISIVQAIIDQIIVKNDDKFGFINYDDNLFQQIISLITKNSLDNYKNVIDKIIQDLQPVEIVKQKLENINQIVLDEIQIETKQNNQKSQIANKNKKVTLKKQKTQQYNQIDQKSNTSFQPPRQNYSQSINNSFVFDQKNDQKVNEEFQTECKQENTTKFKRQTTRQYSLMYNQNGQNKKHKKREQMQQNSEQFSLFTDNKIEQPLNQNQSFAEIQQGQFSSIKFMSSHNLKVPTPKNLSIQSPQKNQQSQQQPTQKQTNRHQRSSFFQVQEAYNIQKEINKIKEESFGPKIFHQSQSLNGLDQQKTLVFEQIKEADQENVSNVKKKLQLQTNFLFHLGIRKALLNFQDLLFQSKNYNQHIKHQSNPCIEYKKNNQINSKMFSQIFKQVQKQFIIISTDFSGVFIDSLFEKLKRTLYEKDIKLLILLLNEQDSTEEYNQQSDQYYLNQCVVKFFYDGQRLLQYLFNLRESKNIHLFPLIVEHY